MHIDVFEQNYHTGIKAGKKVPTGDPLMENLLGDRLYFLFQPVFICVR